MSDFDVLAVVGLESETLHVEPRGAVPDGVRTDGTTGFPVVVIGRVTAADQVAAHAAAVVEYMA